MFRNNIGNFVKKLSLMQKIGTLCVLSCLLSIALAVCQNLIIVRLVSGANHSFMSSKSFVYVNNYQIALGFFLKDIYQNIDLEKIDTDELELNVSSMNKAILGYVGEVLTVEWAKAIGEKAEQDWKMVKEILLNSIAKLKENKKSEFRKDFEKIERDLIAISDMIGATKDKLSSVVEEEYFSATKIHKLNETLMLISGLILILLMAFIFVSLNSIGKSCVNLMRRISHEYLDLDKTSKKILSGSELLAAASTEQAAAIQESVSSMQEMRSMSINSDQLANASQEALKEAVTNAELGSKTMAELVEAVNLIREANDSLDEMNDIVHKISKKSDFINSIVFKTQLLSVNASIEAARAGQHGKGFAVVADEVSKLADSSGKTATEIAEIIDQSGARVREIVRSTNERIVKGNEVALKSQAAFIKIKDGMNSVISNVNKIVSAMSEQRMGIDQANEAIGEMDSASRQNLQVGDNISELSSLLAANSLGLKAVVSDFVELIEGKGKKALDKTEENTSKKTENIQEENLPKKIGKITSDDDSFKLVG